MGSFPVAGPDQASRAEYMRTQLEQMRVSSVECTFLSAITAVTRLKLIRVLTVSFFEEHATAIIKTYLFFPLFVPTIDIVFLSIFLIVSSLY
jgi:hypothetical protein